MGREKRPPETGRSPRDPEGRKIHLGEPNAMAILRPALAVPRKLPGKTRLGILRGLKMFAGMAVWGLVVFAIAWLAFRFAR